MRRSKPYPSNSRSRLMRWTVGAPAFLFTLLLIRFYYQTQILTQDANGSNTFFVDTDNGHVMSQLPSWFGLSPVGTKDTRTYISNDEADFEADYTGMCKDDKLLYEQYFYRQSGGFFLEMGALDGVRFSNTWWFAKHLRWKGLLIEPIPKSYAKLVDNRIESICVNAAICSAFQQVQISHSGDGVAGIFEFMHPQFIETWYTKRNISTDITKMQSITCIPLEYILHKFNIKHIDMFSLDVEGAEYEVLRTIDLSRVKINLIIVENAKDGEDDKNQQVHDYIISFGYKKVGKICMNNIYVLPGFQRSCKGNCV